MFKSIQYNFYFKATYSEDYTFILDNNNKIIYWWYFEINSFESELKNQYIYTKTLIAGIYNFRLNIYIAENIVSILLSYYSPNQQITSINSDNGNIFYDLIPIENKQVNILTYSSPSKITKFYESSSSYSLLSVTFNWEVASNDGCSSIINYKIKKNDDSLSSYIDSVTLPNNQFSYEDNSNISPGNEYKCKIIAINNIGNGKESNELSYYSITLISQPLNLEILLYDEEIFKISWDIPLDTGKGDNIILITSYYLEYKDNSISNSQYTEIYLGTDTSFIYNIKL